MFLKREERQHLCHQILHRPGNGPSWTYIDHQVPLKNYSQDQIEADSHARGSHAAVHITHREDTSVGTANEIFLAKLAPYPADICSSKRLEGVTVLLSSKTEKFEGTPMWFQLCSLSPKPSLDERFCLTLPSPSHKLGRIFQVKLRSLVTSCSDRGREGSSRGGAFSAVRVCWSHSNPFSCC